MVVYIGETQGTLQQGMPLEPVSQEVSDLIKGRKANESKTKRELLFDSSSDDESSQSDEYMDKASLEKMTEVEREAYIFEREQAKQAKKERLELERRIRKMEKQESEVASQSKQSVFERKLRKMEQLRDSKRKRRESDDSDYSEEVEEAEVSPRKSGSQALKSITLSSILSIQLKRDVIENGIYRPSFNDVAQGCFARVNVGRGRNDEPVYRMCQISKIINGSRAYMIGKTSTNIKGLLTIGDSNRECSLDIVSNGPITQEEFDFWLSNCEKCKSKPLNERFINRKEQELQRFVNSPVDEDELKAIIERKKASGTVAVNTAAEKAKLLIELEEAKATGNHTQASQIESKLRQLSNQDKPDTFSTSFSHSRKLFTGGDSTNANNSGELDPFMRRKCKPLDIHFASGSTDTPAVSNSTTPTPQEIKPTASTAATDLKSASHGTVAIADVADAHKNIDFDLEI